MLIQARFWDSGRFQNCLAQRYMHWQAVAPAIFMTLLGNAHCVLELVEVPAGTMHGGAARGAQGAR